MRIEVDISYQMRIVPYSCPGGRRRFDIDVADSQILAVRIDGHRHRSQCRRYPTSDIDIS
jgi:hypothetical protein